MLNGYGYGAHASQMDTPPSVMSAHAFPMQTPPSVFGAHVMDTPPSLLQSMGNHVANGARERDGQDNSGSRPNPDASTNHRNAARANGDRLVAVEAFSTPSGLDNDPRRRPTTVVYRQKSLKYLDHYLVGPLLGTGSYGKVKEGIDTRTLRRVAIKIVNFRHLQPNSETAHKVRVEMSIQRRLEHKNVTKLLDVIERPQKSKVYMVFELLPNRDVDYLLGMMPARRFPPGLARKFFRELMVGIQYLHGQGVVHRDIKPANLMVATDGTLKIADFGVADTLEHFNDERCSSAPGTPAFLPPEIVSPDPLCSVFDLDIWAAGVTLYTMVVGTVPFKAGFVAQMFEAIAHHEPELPESLVDEQLRSLLLCMLHKDPNKRLGVDAVLRHPWVQGPDDDHALAGLVERAQEENHSSFMTYVNELMERGMLDGDGSTGGSAHTLHRSSFPELAPHAGGADGADGGRDDKGRVSLLGEHNGGFGFGNAARGAGRFGGSCPCAIL